MAEKKYREPVILTHTKMKLNVQQARAIIDRAERFVEYMSKNYDRLYKEGYFDKYNNPPRNYLS